MSRAADAVGAAVAHAIPDRSSTPADAPVDQHTAQKDDETGDDVGVEDTNNNTVAKEQQRDVDDGKSTHHGAAAATSTAITNAAPHTATRPPEGDDKAALQALLNKPAPEVRVCVGDAVGCRDCI